MLTFLIHAALCSAMCHALHFATQDGNALAPLIHRIAGWPLGVRTPLYMCSVCMGWVYSLPYLTAICISGLPMPITVALWPFVGVLPFAQTLLQAGIFAAAVTGINALFYFHIFGNGSKTIG